MSKKVGVGVAVFIWKDDRFIMQKRSGTHGSGRWSIPGGHLEFGETLEECARRETKEETNLDINNIRFLALTNDIMPSDGKHYISNMGRGRLGRRQK